MTELLWGGHIWEGSPWVFLGLTVILGGGAAFMTGRALALRWRPVWQVILYALLLAAALRFLHFALFQETLRHLGYYLVDFVVVLLVGLLGYRLTRVRQMITQYRWLYRRKGLFGWSAVEPVSTVPAGGLAAGTMQ